MSKHRTTTQPGRAKVALILGLVLGLATVAYALAETARRPHSSGQDVGSLARKSAGELSLRVKPKTRLVAPGEVARFRVRIRGTSTRRVRLSVVGGVPRGATARFRPRATRRAKSRLTVTTGRAPSGGHRIRLLARRGHRRATAAVNLVITAPRAGADFTISGDLPGSLAPGLTEPLDLALTNPGLAEISISQLLVSIESIGAPQADEAHPCTLEDFSITQFSGAYGFKLGAAETSKLSQLGFPDEQLPRVTMLDLPANQDGCKQASLTFGYSGTSTVGG
jgi:hypothetical protein